MYFETEPFYWALYLRSYVCVYVDLLPYIGLHLVNLPFSVGKKGFRLHTTKQYPKPPYARGLPAKIQYRYLKAHHLRFKQNGDRLNKVNFCTCGCS
jgi:hypothetical protein